MICDLWPDSVRELVEHLKREPFVRFADLPNKPIQRFEGVADGVLCFSDGWRLSFRPSSKREEVGVEFNVGMFRWSCGGAEVRIVYLRSGESLQ